MLIMNGLAMRLREKNQKVPWKKWKWTHNSPKLMGHSEGTPEREVHSNTSLLKKDRNISNKQPHPTPTTARGRTTKKTQSK